MEKDYWRLLKDIPGCDAGTIGELYEVEGAGHYCVFGEVCGEPSVYSLAKMYACPEFFEQIAMGADI